MTEYRTLRKQGRYYPQHRATTKLGWNFFYIGNSRMSFSVLEWAEKEIERDIKHQEAKNSPDEIIEFNPYVNPDMGD